MFGKKETGETAILYNSESNSFCFLSVLLSFGVSRLEIKDSAAEISSSMGMAC